MNFKKDTNYKHICNLFRKIITSLVCIIHKTKDEKIKNDANEILQDLINQYDLYVLKLNSNVIGMKYSEKNIVDFACECYDKIEIMNFAEDLEYGFSELIENIVAERKK